jgi:hypothetical protein
MKVQKDIYHYSFIYYDEQFNDFNLNKYSIALINNLTSDINCEKFIFDFNDKNTYQDFISQINADKLNMIVTYDFFPTGIDDRRCICTLYLGDKRYLQHKTINK